MSRPVIIGGGVAGIAAAVRRAEAGERPILIESRPYLGGRVRSFLHAETGDEIDNGQHLLMGCYHETFRLLDLLGTRGLVDIQPALRVEIREADGTPHLLSAPATLPAPLNVALGMLRFGPLSRSERFGLLRTGLHAMTRRPAAGETVASYLGRLGQSANTRRLLWDPIVLATLNTPAEQASARLFAQVMRLAFMGRGDDSKLAIPRAGLSKLFEPAAKFVEDRDGTVFTGSPVREVKETGGTWRVRTGNGATFETDALISALPWRSFRTLFAAHLPDLPATRHSIPHNTIISLYLWFERSLDEVPEFCALIDTTVQWVFNRRKIAGDSNDRFPGLLCCVISAAGDTAQQDDELLTAVAGRELRSAFPSLGQIRLLTSLVIREKQATFSASPEVERLRPAPGEIRSGLFLAGDWTATGLPGTIEGAVSSGMSKGQGARAKWQG